MAGKGRSGTSSTFWFGRDRPALTAAVELGRREYPPLQQQLLWRGGGVGKARVALVGRRPPLQQNSLCFTIWWRDCFTATTAKRACGRFGPVGHVGCGLSKHGQQARPGLAMHGLALLGVARPGLSWPGLAVLDEACQAVPR